MGEFDPLSSRTRSASFWIVTSSMLPMLMTWPIAFGSTTSFSSAPTTSATCVNERDCVPSPNTVIGSPASACRTKFGITMPYWPGLPRSDGVEEADDDDRQLALFPVRERQELVDRLAARVGPAMLRRRAHHEIGILAERHVLALAVHLGRRRDDDQLLLLVRVLQHDFGAVHVGLDRVDRLLDDQLHADRGGEMKDDVAAIDELGQQRLVVDRVDEVLEAGAPLEVRDVLHRARSRGCR